MPIINFICIHIFYTSFYAGGHDVYVVTRLLLRFDLIVFISTLNSRISRRTRAIVARRQITLVSTDTSCLRSHTPIHSHTLLHLSIDSHTYRRARLSVAIRRYRWYALINTEHYSINICVCI